MNRVIIQKDETENFKLFSLDRTEEVCLPKDKVSTFFGKRLIAVLNKLPVGQEITIGLRVALI